MTSRKHRLLRGMAWAAVLLILLAFTANTIGIYRAGGSVTWSQWLGRHTPSFLLWRVSLYAAMASGWWWIKPAPGHQPLVRLVARATLSLALLTELSLWINPL